ncbi:alpha-hydroxy-acid oxidizing enzyme [Psittacicella melopsittaci]|uniref:Alpha-hydroxy-acid oxidizing enzyme n=1 Tax=Psittacicella melopsittaci TaxID=2028576 RepID=A0A3A1Y896_9GAMM|nr:alpha-hydroxy acid oxidase [Psittacicella melopsittaci]RIY33875.1 alpha-hydroxy-acid oxidizing enzyme [Psittacicella melopsittaci]
MASLDKMTSVEDFKKVAKRRIPRMFYQYVDSGSWTQSTYRRNHDDFGSILFRQKVLVDMDNRSLATKMVGQDVKMPIAVAPTGFTGMVHANGEMLAAKACENFGIPYTLSTMSICSIEDVRSATSAPFWFQLYVMRDREFIENLIHRAKEAHCGALVLTADLQIVGQRHCDVKNGLSAPPKPTLANILNLMTKPSWCLGMAKTKRRSFGNIIGHARGVDNMDDFFGWTKAQFDPTLSWKDVEWIKNLWGGKLIIKGVLDPEDAYQAYEHGADAVIVSNHGGRQLDDTASTIEMLPSILERVGGKLEVFLDGGVYSGQSALKAYALGANGVFIGRPHLWGLGAYGQEGVEKVLSILYDEMDRSMAFCGKTNILDVDKEILLPGTYPVPKW